MKKITLNNIKQYIEGNSNMFLETIGLQSKMYKEQIAYRMLKCKDDCIPNTKCVICGCDVPGKLYVTKSCNDGLRFPDLMDEDSWNVFKQQNEIK